MENELVKIKCSNNPNILEKVLRESNKTKVNNKNETILDYVGHFEMVGNLKVGEQVRRTHIRFRKIDDCESYFNSIDEGYDGEDASFEGYIYKKNTPQFNEVNRSQYGYGCDFKHKIIEHRGNICFIPTKGYCFVKCNNLPTGQDYEHQNLDFIRSEQRRSNIMNMA